MISPIYSFYTSLSFKKVSEMTFTFVILNLFLSFITGLFFFVPHAKAMPTTVTDLENMVKEVASTGLGPADFPPLNNASYISVNAAAMAFDNDDVIFIVPIGVEKPLAERDVLLIPQKIMVWHEVMNVINKDMSLAITYSPVSGSLAVYNTRTKNYFLQLQFQGSIYNGNSVLTDANTNSLWSQIYGLSFFGTLRGTGLNILPSYWTTWENVRTFFADNKNAKVLSSPRGGRRYGKDPYGSYIDKNSFYYNDALIYPIKKLDIRLNLKSQVVGLEDNGRYMAVEVDFVKEKKCVNFFLGARPMVAVHDTRLDIIRIFERDVWDGEDPLIFKVEEDGILRDFQTKSSWSNDGVCEYGNYIGAYLKEVSGIYAFWYSWATHFQDTEIIPGPSAVPDSALEIGVPVDSQLTKGLDGPIYTTDMHKPWNPEQINSTSNYSDRKIEDNRNYKDGNRPSYEPETNIP